MSIVQNEIYGKNKGRIGNVILYNVDGQQRMRVLPLHIRDAKSPAQLLNRAKFNYIQKWSRTLQPIIRLGFQQRLPGRSIFNMFYHYNHSKVNGDRGEGLYFTWKELICSFGPLSIPKYRISFDKDTHTIHLEILAHEPMGSVFPTDKVMFCGIDTQKTELSFMHICDRFTPCVETVKLHAKDKWEELFIYVFAYNTELKLSSTSIAHSLKDLV